MPEIDRDRRREEATAIFKLGLKASKAGVHRTLNRPPRGKGWVQCVNSPAGLMCRPDKVRESIAHFERAYQKFPDIVALNQIALGYEMLGDFEAARQNFSRMREQALAESIAAYVQAAELGLARLT
jgi:tetratricopeptide (TPR) repeat protein